MWTMVIERALHHQQVSRDIKTVDRLSPYFFKKGTSRLSEKTKIVSIAICGIAQIIF